MLRTPGISQFKQFRMVVGKNVGVGPESVGIVVCRFVGTVPDILGLVWPSFRPKSVLKSKSSGRILQSVRGPCSSAGSKEKAASKEEEEAPTEPSVQNEAAEPRRRHPRRRHLEGSSSKEGARRMTRLTVVEAPRNRSEIGRSRSVPVCGPAPGAFGWASSGLGPMWAPSRRFQAGFLKIFGAR